VAGLGVNEAIPMIGFDFKIKFLAAINTIGQCEPKGSPSPGLKGFDALLKTKKPRWIKVGAFQAAIGIKFRPRSPFACRRCTMATADFSPIIMANLTPTGWLCTKTSTGNFPPIWNNLLSSIPVAHAGTHSFAVITTNK